MTDGIDLAVSTVIFAIRPAEGADGGVLSIPLVRRTRDPFARRWSLPGGAAHLDEGLSETARRTLIDTTNRYLCPEPEFWVNPNIGTPQDQEILRALLSATFSRERPPSRPRPASSLDPDTRSPPQAACRRGCR